MLGNVEKVQRLRMLLLVIIFYPVLDSNLFRTSGLCLCSFHLYHRVWRDGQSQPGAGLPYRHEALGEDHRSDGDPQRQPGGEGPAGRNPHPEPAGDRGLETLLNLYIMSDWWILRLVFNHVMDFTCWVTFIFLSAELFPIFMSSFFIFPKPFSLWRNQMSFSPLFYRLVLPSCSSGSRSGQLQAADCK